MFLFSLVQWLCVLVCMCVLAQEEQTQFMYSETGVDAAVNYMDRWIISFTQSLVMFVQQEMQGHYSTALIV